MINEFEKGIGIAGFLLSISAFATLVNKKVLTIDEALKSIEGSRTYSSDPNLFPGEPNTIKSADVSLEVAQKVLIRLTTSKASS